MTKRGREFAVHVRVIRKSLTTIDRDIRDLAGALDGYYGLGGSRVSPPRRKLTITPARRAALKLQGQYMGYLRNLKPRQKAEVKAARETTGVRAAIGVARRLGNA